MQPMLACSGMRSRTRRWICGFAGLKGACVNFEVVSRVPICFCRRWKLQRTVTRIAVPTRPGVCQSAKSVRRRLWRATCEMAQRRVEGFEVVVVVVVMVQDDVWGWSES